ncbi:MAG: type II toxin-antitoxin system PemK/MazF family toxin [Nocardioidaceae bacterium]
MWFVDFDPVRGHEQGKDRPALVVSSADHLKLTRGSLVTVLPLTTVEKPWRHRVHVEYGDGWVITEQVRTVSAERFRRPAPGIALTDDELSRVRAILTRMLTL